MSTVVNNAEKFLWNNFKMYLMQYPTCFLDNLLKIKDGDATDPVERYEDFVNQLETHMGLGSYVVNQAAQFSTVPYVTVNIQPIPTGKCGTRVVMGFDIVFTTDSPSPNSATTTQYVGNSSEAVAAFRANIANGLDQIFHNAFADLYDENTGPAPNKAFFDRLREQELINPLNHTQTKVWDYNIIGMVDDDNTISEVEQLRREDRSSGIAVFHVVYTLDINRIYGDGIDCGC